MSKQYEDTALLIIEHVLDDTVNKETNEESLDRLIATVAELIDDAVTRNPKLTPKSN